MGTDCLDVDADWRALAGGDHHCTAAVREADAQLRKLRQLRLALGGGCDFDLSRGTAARAGHNQSQQRPPDRMLRPPIRVGHRIEPTPAPDR